MAVSEEDGKFPELIGLIYESALDDERHTDVLERVEMV